MQNGHLQRSGGLSYSSRRAIFQSLAARFFGRTSTIGMYLDRCAIKPKTIDRHADHVVLLQSVKQPIQNARISPTAHPGVYRVPLSEPFRQGPPFAAIFGDKEDGIDHGQV